LSTIAEAFVLVRPDTRSFAAELQKQLAAAVGSMPTPTVKVNARVVAQGQMQDVSRQVQKQSAAEVAAAGEIAVAHRQAGLAAVTAAQQRVRASAAAEAAVEQAAEAAQRRQQAQQAGARAGLRLSGLAVRQEQQRAAAALAAAAAEKQADKLFRDSLAVRKASASAAEKFARVETAGAVAQSEVAKKRAQLLALLRADRAAQESVNVATARGSVLSRELAVAMKTQTAAAVDAAKAELGLAIATAKTNREQALSVASAEAQRTARLSQAARGGGAAALAFGGLRGAVLASTGPFLAATVAVTALGKAIGAAANTEQQLNIFQATARATGEEMQRVAATAKQLGADITLPGVSAGDAALTMTELAKAGLSVQQSIDGARGVLQLATAANIDFSAASEIAASRLNAFSLSGTDASRVADLLAGASIAAQGGIEDFGIAAQQVDAVARQVGVSIEDTTTLLALLAKNGLRGSDAGTSLRTAFIRLINPTQEARALIDQLGLSIRDAQGNIDPLVFAKYGEAVSGLAPDLRDMLTATIFGQDAIRAVSIAAREGASGFDALAATVEQAGNAQRLTEARAKGLKGAMGGLQSNLETTGSTIGSLLLPFLETSVRVMAEAAKAAGVYASAIKSLGEKFADLIPGGKKTRDIAKDVAVNFLKFAGPQGVFFGAAKAIDVFTTSSDEAAASLAKTQQGIKDFADRTRTFSLGDEFGFKGIASTASDKRVKDLEARNKKILELIGQLHTGLETFGNTGQIDTAAIDSLISTVNQLKNLGGSAVQEALRQNAKGISKVLLEDLRNVASEFGVTIDSLNVELPQRLANIINLVAQNTPQQAAQVGRQVIAALAEGIKSGDEPDRAGLLVVKQFIKALQKGGPEAQAAAKQLGDQLGDAFAEGALAKTQRVKDALTSAFSGIGVKLPQTDLPADLKQAIDDAKNDPNSRALLEQYGAKLDEWRADGLRSATETIDAARDTSASAARSAVNAGRAVVAAQRAITDAQRGLVRAAKAASEALVESVGQARDRLQTLAGEIADSLGRIIDVGPLGEQAQKLNDQLDKVQARLDRFNKRNERKSASDALASAQRDLEQERLRLQGGAIGMTEKERRTLTNQFLAPLQQRVTEERNNVRQIDLQNQADTLASQLEGVGDAAEDLKKTLTLTLSNLAFRAGRGDITQQQFAARARAIAVPRIAIAKGPDGKPLGEAFAQDLVDKLAAFIKQGGTLQGFTDTKVPASVVDPADVFATGAVAFGDATQALSDAKVSFADAQTAFAKAKDDQAKQQAAYQRAIIDNTAAVKAQTSVYEKAKEAVKNPKVPTQTTGGPPKDRNKDVNGGATTGVVRK